MLTDQEYMSYIASLHSAKQIALMANTSAYYPNNAPFFTGISGLAGHETPVANILHNKNNLTTNMTLYLNYAPSDLELGMAWRAEISEIFFVKSRNPLVIGQYNIDADGFNLQTPCRLTEVNLNRAERQFALEISEPRLKQAFNDSNCFKGRDISPSTITALGRGLHADTLTILDTREQRKIDEDFIRIAVSLVDRGWNSKDGSNKPEDRIAGNNIGAIMVDKDNNIIGWGLNLKSENKTYHAETLMIQRYLNENKKNTLPDGVRIYTSLECCPMCSGHITTLGKDIKVIYAQKDPYFNGENTLAQGKNGCSQQPTTLPFPELFKEAMGDQEQILDFLFSKKARDIFAKGYQHAALLLEMMEFVAQRMKSKELQMNLDLTPPLSVNVSPILQYGEQFMKSLGNFIPPSPSLPQTSFFCSRSPSLPHIDTSPESAADINFLRKAN